MRSEIAVIMTAALADAAAPAIEPDERAENDVGCCQSGMVCRLLRAPGSFFQRLAQSPATKVHRFDRSEEHTSELQSLMRISYAVFCLKKKKTIRYHKLSNDKQQYQLTSEQTILHN